MNLFRYCPFVLGLLAPVLLSSQSKTSSFGVGVNSNMYQNLYQACPQLPVSPYLTLRVNHHELIAGTDIYSYFKTNTFVFGAQADYRYHFLREHKRNNFFVEINAQYVQYQKSCSDPAPYYQPNYFPCSDDAVFRYRTGIATLGLGIELFLCKRFSFYSVLAGGANVVEAKVFKDAGEFRSSDQNVYRPIGSLRFGLSYNVFVRKKNACDSCPH